MPFETLPYDVVQHLTDPGDQAELIAKAVASGNASIIRQALNIVARARGVAQVAREAGLTGEALHEALAPDGDPRMSTLLGVLGALGIKLSASPRAEAGAETRASP